MSWPETESASYETIPSQFPQNWSKHVRYQYCVCLEKRASRSRLRSRITGLNTRYRQAPGLPLSCPDYSIVRRPCSRAPTTWSEKPILRLLLLWRTSRRTPVTVTGARAEYIFKFCWKSVTTALKTYWKSQKFFCPKVGEFFPVVYNFCCGVDTIATAKTLTPRP